MTIAISCRDDPKLTWIVQRSVYQWFADLAAEKHPGDQDLLHQLAMAEATNGVALDPLHSEHPRLAERLKAALDDKVSAIAEGL